jgi:hypothetical protein
LRHSPDCRRIGRIGRFRNDALGDKLASVLTDEFAVADLMTVEPHAKISVTIGCSRALRSASAKRPCRGRRDTEDRRRKRQHARRALRLSRLHLGEAQHPDGADAANSGPTERDSDDNMHRPRSSNLQRQSRAFCQPGALRMNEGSWLAVVRKRCSSITSSPRWTLTPQHGQTPCAP